MVCLYRVFIMKKLLLSCSLMILCLFVSMNILTAAYVTVQDTDSYAHDQANYAIVTLSGQRDTSTDRLSNVKTSKIVKGKVLVVFDTIQRPNQFSANVDVSFRYQGLYQGYVHLSIGG